MSRCFVIQPFDSDEFDKRYNDILKPTIEEMGLEAYRVDNDPTVTSIIKAIENGIREADVCLADISTDNPNVWLELGYARASSRSIVMICSRKHRDKLPFDIQDHAVIFYDSDSPRDFESLKLQIHQRIEAVQKQPSPSVQSNDDEDILPSLSHQITKNQALLLYTIIQESTGPKGQITTESLRRKATSNGLSTFDIEVEFRTLLNAAILKTLRGHGKSGRVYTIIEVTDYGIDCMNSNRKLIDEVKAEIDGIFPF